MKLSKKHYKIIVLVVIGLISFISLMVSRSDGSTEAPISSEIPLSKKDHDFSYDEVTKAYESANKNGRLNNRNNTEVNPFTDPNANDSDNVFDLQQTQHRSSNAKSSPTNSNYSAENDPKMIELQKQIELLEAKNKGKNTQVPQREYTNQSNVNTAPVKTKEQLELEYRQMLIQAKQLKKNQSQDYSATEEVVNTVSNSLPSSLEFKVEIYKDQFILPGDRVTMLLTEPISYKGNSFEKNTFIYGVANISSNRIMINVTNINHIPVNLVAKDITDGNIGLYSKRAGELWSEFRKEADSGVTDEVSNEITRQTKIPLVGTTIKAFSNFFKKKRYRQHDKIPLFDDSKIILTNKN